MLCLSISDEYFTIACVIIVELQTLARTTGNVSSSKHDHEQHKVKVRTIGCSST